MPHERFRDILNSFLVPRFSLYLLIYCPLFVIQLIDRPLLRIYENFGMQIKDPDPNVFNKISYQLFN